MTIEKLQRGIQTLQLNMPALQQERLLDFLLLLQKWNKSYNLTAITEMDEMITHHALDSLAVVPYLSGDRIIDIGTGAGFPGIPLALYFPDKKFTLLDSNGKKTRFLVQAKAALAIDNIEVVHARAETYHTDICFDAIIFRAVTSIADMIDKTQHLCCEHGQYFAMKGSVPTEELKRIDAPSVYALTVPGLNAERHLVVVEGGTGD
jgi:16S rRNA (guanine527-N7)-methyltransferase